MSDKDIVKMLRMIQGTSLPIRVWQHHMLRAAGEIEQNRIDLEEYRRDVAKLAEERDRLQDEVERLRNEKVAGVAAIEAAGAGLSPASGQAPATDPVYTGGMNDLCVTIPHLSEREKALFVAALKGDAGPTTPPAAEPAPAVCEWDSRTTVFPMPTCNPAAAFLNRIHRDGDMCPLCCKPIKFTEAKE